MHRPSRLVGARPISTRRSGLFFVLTIRSLLWLAASLVSALLVYWLHFKPAYGEHWTAGAGTVLFLVLSVYAAISCLNSVVEAVALIHKRDGATRQSEPARKRLALKQLHQPPMTLTWWR